MKTEHPFTTFRRDRGLTISQFADLVEVDRTAVSKCEHGYRDGLGRNANLRIEEKTEGALTFEALAKFAWPRRRRVRKGMRSAAVAAASTRSATS